MQCDILYNSSNIGKLRIAINAYLKNGNFNMFKSFFLRGSLPKELRVTLKSSDDLEDVQRSIISFYNDVRTITDQLIAQNPDNIPTITNLLSQIETEFHIDADETQSASSESDSEVKTLDELHDANRRNLLEHLKDIYGLESYELIKSLDQDFYDLVIEAAYYNSKTGESVNISNKTLNKNFSQLKQELLSRIRTYLVENDIPFKDTFYGIQSAFYNYIKNLQDFKTRLESLQSDKIHQRGRENKVNLFKALIHELEKDQKFHKNVVSKLNKYKKTRLEEDLYAGDCYSTSYLAVRKYVLESRPDLMDKIKEIEAVEVNLLEATNAYSMISHFDEMLVDKLGKQISIQSGTEGIEVEGKYSYHQDTAHEIKGWQTSEAIGSEKHMSKFTQAVLSQIRIFDHKTGDYQNRRLDGTSFIVAARHLMDDILYGNIKIGGGSKHDAISREMLLRNVTTFHENPQVKFQEILQLLFDTTEGWNTQPLYTKLSNKKLLTDRDLDILYSIYLKVFNLNDPSSFISQELESQANNTLGSGLMQEIAAYVDSNITMDYLETSVDWETGEIDLKVKKKYFNSAQLYKLRKSINSELNNKSLDRRKELQDTYELLVTEPAAKVTHYSVKIGDTKVTLEVPNGKVAKILTHGTPGSLFKFSDKTIFDVLGDIDLIAFRQKLNRGLKLTDSEIQLKQLLQFIDDFLNLNILSDLGLQTLQTYQNTYTEIDGMSNYLMPLVQLAIRAAYVNDQYVRAGDKSLAEYLEDDSIFKYYKENPKSKLFVESFGNVKYVVASFQDKVLDMWVDSISMLTGEASKATTKDGQGNSIPNNSVGKLGGILHYYLYKQNGTNCASLMFVDNPGAIKATFHDLEASNIHGDTKSIKQFSCGELFHHAIFNKFWASYSKSGNVVIQPTVYSDKTTFLNWEISTKLKDGTDLLTSSDYIAKVLQEYKETLGAFYRNVYLETVDKLDRIAKQYNLENGTNYTTKQVLKLLDEKALLALGKKLNIDLEKDKDYRVRKKTVVKQITNPDGTINEVEETVNYCTINEILEYNARVYNDDQLLWEALEKEKYNFLQNLISYNASFQVLDYNDDIDYYTSAVINEKATSKNAIISTILKVLTKSDERIDFFKNWVDAKTGKLILAKQGGRNILGIGGDFDINEPGMELNPFLSKFFYVEGLMSNNLRMSLTGSEINHPDKAKGVFLDKVKKITNHVDLKIETGIELTPEQFVQFKSIIDTCDDVTDLLPYLGDPIIDLVYDLSITKIINTAQGTQFKRNVIIPATLQYCQQKTKNGVPPKIKCAVIYDEKAPVHNYRGETDTVDSADGSAQINPFQSILENLSLGSQAVGFIKKPIWHSYDTSGGTAFLAKFATDTITNEVMRASMYSKTSLFRMFKRMTNLQWDEPIDLTKPIVRDTSIAEDATKVEAYESWFKSVILEGQDLYYENKFGRKIQIKSLNKTTTKTGETFYYTEEQDGYGEIVKVYHMFDEDSNHYTFNSYQKALAFYQNNPGSHTINSLFELHSALGGIYCVDSTGKGSEFNNKVVVNYMNNIGTRKEGVSRGALVNQDNYYQPLKQYHIGYALNNTAVKNGAKNVNPASAWEGNSELSYFEVDSDGLGMQMNADHDIVDSELTEFSQVIAATSAYGYTYENCDEIFKGLAKTAFQASKHVLESVDKFLSTLSPEAHSDLYDAVGRIVLMEGSIKDRESLTHIIEEAVLKVFNKNKDHRDDDVKIPFSDSNIYSEFVATLASSITKASIKRKHPGSGCVMVPGYNMVTYFEIGDKKYSHREMVVKARTALTQELIEIAKTTSKYNPENNTLDGKPLGAVTLQDMFNYDEVLAYLNAISPDRMPIYSIQDSVTFSNRVVEHYLDKLQEDASIFDDKSYFQPEDVVRIITPTGELEQTIVLDSMEKYYAFKDRIDLPGTKYQVDVKTPRNLKPSLIRWKYINGQGQKVYMNIFDHPVIKGAFTRKGKLNAEYRKQVQDILHNLHDGFFIMDGIRYELVPNSLENTEAELVMSNIYKDVFGIENESLQEILDQGEQFFVDQISSKLHAPVNPIYDVALLNDNGKHTLIKFGEVTPTEYCVENDFTAISVNEKDEIYCMKGNRPLFKIGKYFNLTGDEAEDLYITEEGKIASKSGRYFDEKMYRINKSRIQKRVDFVKRYKLTSKATNRKTGQVYYTTNVMYKIIDRHQLAELYGNEQDAHKQIGSLITDIYLQDNYKFVELNPMKGDVFKNQAQSIKGYFGWFMGNDYVNPDHKAYLQAQLDSLGGSSKENVGKLKALKQAFYEKEAHKKWVSFQDSLKFISSRIPAQTLQSFMTMKCVGWTENTKNMAYVSHFQIYLQGSDYDIDKAYIMGQSYDSNGVYIQWSPLFDYTDAQTLYLSKQLPTPENFNLELSEEGVDITNELVTLLQNTDSNLEPLSYDARLVNLKTYASLLKKINKYRGKIKYNIPENPKIDKIINLLYKHIKYEIPENVAEAAYKNVASANIYAVSHDVRNRDQAYTAISMSILQKAASKSPKGEQAASLNMLNPLTKYIMQYQNIVGKNVISIAANGEKIWFNAYYYWTKLLKEGRPKYLQFQTNLRRVAGRAKLKTNQLSMLSPEGRTVRALPDLNARDLELKRVLLNEFGVDLDEDTYAYVDQLISQLLSAATDNAKELILAKINSGNNFARMYVYLIMTGYNFDDIVAFMISPVSEFIDSMSNPNMFQDSDLGNSPSKAINLAKGIVKSYSYLHGTISYYDYDPDNGDRISKSMRKSKYVLELLNSSDWIDQAKAALGRNPEDEVKDLDTLMRGFIMAAMSNSAIDLTVLADTKDSEINNYLQYCQSIAYKLRDVASQYESLEEMQEDVREFGKIYSLSSEISSIASAWLGLNQGLPTDELSLLKRFASMRKVVIDRERALEIYPGKLFTESDDPNKIDEAREYRQQVISAIIENNPVLTEVQVEEALRKAYEKDLIGTFDVYRYLTDMEYRRDMIDYVHIIKGTLNVLDMMEEIPHYKEIINCLKALAVSKQNLSSKSRLINKLIQDADLEYLNDTQLRGIIRYVDKLNGFNFARSIGSAIVLDSSIEGFNSYFEKNERTRTSVIDLSTLEGVATFKHWVEHEFLEDLKENYKDNPLVKHLQKVPENQRDILATDIDLLNPNTTSITRQSYDDILKGMARFEQIFYGNTGYTIADIFQLYNILINSNQYGAERLTTAFKACSREDSILNRYLKFISEQDYAIDVLQDYEMIDYYINAAPIVSTGAERFKTEKFIKVNDPVEGYILKQYDPETNEYKRYDMIPARAGVETESERLRRLQHFAEFCPFEMPTMARIAEIFAAIDYEGDLTDDVITRIQNILLDFSSVGKLIVFKDC